VPISSISPATLDPAELRVRATLHFADWPWATALKPPKRDASCRKPGGRSVHELEYRTIGPRDGDADLPPQSGMAEDDIPRWVDLHWPCAAAMLESGVMNEAGEWVEDKDVRLGIEAYRERLFGNK
jgi:hypothetical protein